MKVATIVGARPQFIKAAVLSRVLASAAGGAREVLIHTGQHFDANMSDVFFDELGIRRPDHHLGIGGGTHGQNTGRMLERIEAVLMDERPDWVVVYGDTDSTMAGALAAVKLHLRCAHVEAGLRSFNRGMPEEINRVLTDHAADLLLTPTDTATKNLAAEGLAHRARQTGDVMFDAALWFGEQAEARSDVLGRLGLAPRAFVLATIHRAENTDDDGRLRGILDGFAASAQRVVWPMHPRTRLRLAAAGLRVPGTVTVTDPLGYLDMVRLERNASLIATDSGGVQKEAFFHGVPCLTLRSETEWVELVDAGWNAIVDPRVEGAVAAVFRSLPVFARRAIHPYGDGHAGEAIAAALRDA